MAVEKLPERVRTKPVAEAMFSPSAILLGGGAAAAAILVGLWPIAPVAAIAGWAARVAMAVPKRRKLQAIEPRKLPDPWRTFVIDASRARQRFEEVVRTVPAGPLRDELGQVAGRVSESVRECWEIAKRGAALDAARAQLGLGQAAGELDRLRGERGLRAQQGMDVSSVDQAIEAVGRQLEAGRRVETTAFEARDRLRVLNARLDEAVAAVVELTLRPGASSAGSLSGQVDGIVDQLHALRSALDEVSPPAVGTTPPAPPTLEAR